MPPIQKTTANKPTAHPLPMRCPSLKATINADPAARNQLGARGHVQARLVLPPAGAAFFAAAGTARRLLLDEFAAEAQRDLGVREDGAEFRRAPPIASMCFRSVLTCMSLRLSIFEIAPWAMFRFRAMSTWVSLRSRRRSSSAISALYSRTRVSTRARAASGSLLSVEFEFTGHDIHLPLTVVG